jgi:hypothetical protein
VDATAFADWVKLIVEPESTITSWVPQLKEIVMKGIKRKIEKIFFIYPPVDNQ